METLRHKLQEYVSREDDELQYLERLRKLTEFQNMYGIDVFNLTKGACGECVLPNSAMCTSTGDLPPAPLLPNLDFLRLVNKQQNQLFATNVHKLVTPESIPNPFWGLLSSAATDVLCGDAPISNPPSWKRYKFTRCEDTSETMDNTCHDCFGALEFEAEGYDVRCSNCCLTVSARDIATDNLVHEKDDKYAVPFKDRDQYHFARATEPTPYEHARYLVKKLDEIDVVGQTVDMGIVGDLTKYFKSHRINSKTIKWPRMRAILKKLGHSKYKHVHVLVYHFTGVAPPRVSDELRKQVMEKFLEVYAVYERLRGKRKSMLNYNFLLNNILRGLGYAEFCEYYPILNTPTSKATTFRIWRQCCMLIQFPFFEPDTR